MQIRHWCSQKWPIAKKVCVCLSLRSTTFICWLWLCNPKDNSWHLQCHDISNNFYSKHFIFTAHKSTRKTSSNGTYILIGVPNTFVYNLCEVFTNFGVCGNEPASLNKAHSFRVFCRQLTAVFCCNIVGTSLRPEP